MPSAAELYRENVEVFARSDVGMRRSNNQDSHAVALAGDRQSWRQRGHLLIVADGMGAHAAGELASKLAADNVPHTYHKQAELPAPAALEKAIHDANSLIHGRGQADAAFNGMGTTCSALALLPEGAIVAHVGDSRVYRLRQNVLEQLTFDHSLVWEMVASGQVQSEDVAGFVPKNVITRSLGPNAKVKVDVEGPFPIEVGDSYLLCSDGLTGPVRDEEIAAVLAALPLEEAVQTLIDLANLRGGPDNITVVAARVHGPLDEPNAETPSHARKSEPGQVHPALWTGMVLLLMVALVLFVLHEPIAAGLCVIGSLLVGGVALLQRSGGGPSDRNFHLGGPYGKGPYRRYDGHASLAMAATFADTIRRLIDAARRDAAPVDWQHFDQFKQSAESAAARQNYSQALVQYCHAIRYMTGELQKVRGR